MTATAAGRLIAPFRGLAPFDESELDALLFFGRETETEIAVANLLAARLTILYGPSGVGKSSLLRAGVTRRVRELAGKRAIGRGPDGAAVVVSSWADDPVATIAAAIADEVTSLVKRAVAPPTDGSSLADVVDHWSSVLEGDLYLVLDQLEELFVYHGGEPLVGELPEVVLRPRLRANVLLSLRDDALAQLDVFKGSIPNLFANYLRLDRLDRTAATAAILGPVQRWNDIVPDEQRVDIEPELVDAVLAQAAVAGEPERVEPPYLQLVMERVWNTEHEAGSKLLRAATLRELGGAGAIVREHLDRALGVLDGPAQEAAARMFEHLVTPSGTKIAHRASDLAEFARVPVASATPVLATLGRERILRSLDEGAGAGDRFEIFHDVLAEAILGWRRRRDLERERTAARRRQRRLAAVAFGAILLAAVMVGVTLYALSTRSDARHQAERAIARQKEFDALTLLATDPQRSLRMGLQALAVDRSSLDERVLRDGLLASHEVRSLPLGAPALAMVVSADETRAAVATRGSRAVVFDLKGERRLATLATDARLRSLALTPDGNTVATGDAGGHIVLWSAAGGRVRTATAHGAVDALAFSPDGRLLAAAGQDQHVLLLDRATGRVLHRLNAGVIVQSLVFSPRGDKLLALGRLKTMWVFAVASGRRLYPLTQAGSPRVAAFSPDGSRIVTAGADANAYEWSAAHGKLLHHLPVGTPPASVTVTAVVFAHDGSFFATAGTDATARLWNTETGEPQTFLIAHTAPVVGVAFSQDDQLVVTASADRTARIWEPIDGFTRETIVGDAGGVVAAQFLPGATRVVTASTDGTLRFWDAQFDPVMQTVGEIRGHATGVAFLDRTTAVSAGSDGVIRLWNIPRRRLVGRISAGVPLTDVAAGDGGAIAASASDGHVFVWRPDGTRVATLSVPAPARSVAFSSDGRRLVVAAGDRSARLLTIAGGAAVTTRDHASTVNDAALSPDGKLIATASADGLVRLWRATDGKPVATLEGHEKSVLSVVFSHDGRLLLTTSLDHDLRIWNVAAHTTVRVLRGHAAFVSGGAFSANDKWVASAGPAKVGVWDVGGNDFRDDRLFFLDGSKTPLDAVAFSPEGNEILSAGQDGAVRVYDCLVCGSLDQLAAQARTRLAALARN